MLCIWVAQPSCLPLLSGQPCRKPGHIDFLASSAEREFGGSFAWCLWSDGGAAESGRVLHGLRVPLLKGR